MLPKKRKFTPTEYQTWIPEPPEAHQSSVQSSRSQEDNEVAINLVRSEAKATTLDLTEWVGHRILARRDDFFCPGIIKAAYKDNSLAVDFESEETPLIYSNVLSRGDFDTIISDAVPATNQVLYFYLLFTAYVLDFCLNRYIQTIFTIYYLVDSREWYPGTRLPGFPGIPGPFC